MSSQQLPIPQPTPTLPVHGNREAPLQAPSDPNPRLLTMLKRIVSLPRAAFQGPDATERPLHAQVWDAQLDRSDFRQLLLHANDELEKALWAQLETYEEETKKLREILRDGIPMPAWPDVDGYKGDVITNVIRRWDAEEVVERLRCSRERE